MKARDINGSHGKTNMLEAITRQLESDLQRLLDMQHSVGGFIDAWRTVPRVAGNFSLQLEDIRAAMNELRSALPKLQPSTRRLEPTTSDDHTDSHRLTERERT